MYMDVLKEGDKVLKFSGFGLATSSHIFAYTPCSSLPFPISRSKKNFGLLLPTLHHLPPIPNRNIFSKVRK